MQDSVVIVEKSTVPIGTAQMITKIIAEMSIKENVNKYVISSNP
jgi:UDP-glucose 6-dehydrogenase